MRFEAPSRDELENESDVEQKLVFPFLAGEQPFGLGIPTNAIHTKKNIRRFAIGKGADRKIYFPDYLIVLGGFPLVAIEAKAPGEDLEEAFREVRLYAAELNAVFGPGLNPLMKVAATDGTRLVAGVSDHALPQIEIELSEFGPYSEKVSRLQSLIGQSVLEKDFARLSKMVKPDKLWKPRRLLGGVSIQQEEIGHNSFGATISAEFAHIFNPRSTEDRTRVAREGYIPSRRRERYVDPIDRVIRAARPPSEVNARAIQDTGAPSEIIGTLKSLRPLEHQVLLIVGSVGAGKSTFIDHLQYAALPREILDTTVWVRVNMNDAPISAGEIYNWLRKEIISGCRSAYPSIDFHDLHSLEALFSVEVNQFKKGVGQLYQGNQQTYNEKLAEHITKLQADLHQTAIAYCRYCSTERGKLLILVLDNCDKRTRDQQLLMFQAAQWVQKEFRTLVILPLREETYDNHRDQPPLDTALKDLVFRIEPPLFHNVLVSRVQMALDEIRKSGERTFRYDLPNGFHVEYPASDKAYYLTSIIRAVFDYDRHIRRIIIGLSGRNIRRALEMFLEFCTSGHIKEDHIFRIRQSEGQYVLPLFLVIRVLLRMNRRFYDSDYSYVKNLLAIDAKDVRPNYFSRLMILRWLFRKFSHQGPAGLKGYFAIKDLIAELSTYGIEEGIARREIEYLVKAQCVLSEDFRVEGLTDSDLVRLAPAGFVQLELLNSVDYIAAVAEDTWFESESTARRVAERIKNLEDHYHPNTAIANARDVLDFMKVVRDRDGNSSKAILERSDYDDLTDLSDSETSVARLERSLTPPVWVDVVTRYPIGTEVIGTVVNVKSFGVFVELEPGVTGLIHVSRLPTHFEGLDEFSFGERVVVNILAIDSLKQRIDMAFVRPAHA